MQQLLTEHGPASGGNRGWRRGRAALALLAFLGVTACGGGGGGEASNADTDSQDGAVLVGLTDADGDLVHYTVDVVSLTLDRADGSQVETLSVAGRLDFAQYRDLTELFTAARVPAGLYVGGTITLDYSDADIQVESAGSAVPATVVDAAGQALQRYTLELRLGADRPLVVRPGLPAFLSVDFDLDASHTVDLGTAPPRVTAAPFLVAELEPVTAKDLRVRGGLGDVDTAAGTYAVDLRPFHRGPGTSFGTVTVHTDPATRFEVDGVGFEGAAGLEALAGLAPGSPTVAFGTLTTGDGRRFDAATVLAGTSVPGTGRDAVLGHVTARSGDSLTVKGATLVRPGGVMLFRDTVTVDLGADTVVRRLGQGDGNLGTAAVSVGQRVEILGELVGPAGPPTHLDASPGLVRLLVTAVAGTVNGTLPGQLDLDVDLVDRRPVGIFDFRGTGQDPSTDADPADYEIATGDLELASLQAGDVVRVLGHVTAFGAAPPDFQAFSTVRVGTRHARLGIGWGAEGTAAPFSAANPDGLVLDLANPDIGARHSIVIGGVTVDLLDLPAPPVLVPAPAGPQRYALLAGRRVILFQDFATFVTAVNTRLGSGSRALGLWAEGAWDQDGGQFDVRSLGLALTGAEGPATGGTAGN